MLDDSQHPIVLFDGVCNLCERSVQFVIRNDRDAKFRMASLQSVPGQRLLAGFHYVEDELSSVLLIENGKLFRKSRAALRIARRLDGAWPLLYYLFFWIPPSISNLVYDFIGNRRYRWFGKKEECWLPTDKLRSRFLDDDAFSA
jgi:predicted DCC family thiol-disulfide oxidoreductase YuxK